MKRNILKFLFILCAIPLSVPVYASDEGYTNYNNHPEIVDLGLSICWADRNVGANSPEEPGGQYFFSETNCIGDRSLNQNKDFIYREARCNNKFEIRGTKYDVARVKWGGAWRLPTPEEIKELLDSCSIEYTQNGAIFTGPNGNSIFLPLPTKDYNDVKYSSDCISEFGHDILKYGYGLYLGNFPDLDYKLFVRPVINRAKDGTIINDYPNPSEDSYNTKLGRGETIIDGVQYCKTYSRYGYDYAEVEIYKVKINDTNIKSFKIPQRVYINNRWESVIKVDPEAFINCPNIETFELESDHIQCIDGVLYNSEKTEVLAIAPGKKGTLKIEDGVLSLEEICDNTNDSKYKKIDKIIIPASFNEFYGERYGNFHNLWKFPNLTSFEVSEDNPCYCSIDGVLFSKDKTELICYPPAKSGDEYTIPVSVEKIGHRVFCENENLKKVISLPLYPPICEGSIGNTNTTLYVYSDALDAYEEAWGEEGWKSIDVLDPMPVTIVVLIILGCLVALALVGFLVYKYLLPYIKQQNENKKMERNTNYSPTENRKWMRITSAAAIVALVPVVIIATLCYIFDSDFFFNTQKELFIIQFIGCIVMFIGLLNTKKQYVSYENISGLNYMLFATGFMTIVHLFIVFPDLLQGVLGLFLRNINPFTFDYESFFMSLIVAGLAFAFLVNLLMYLGIKKLTENSYVFRFKYTALSYLLIGIIPSVFALFVNLFTKSYKSRNPLDAFNSLEDDLTFAKAVCIFLIIAFVGCFIVACIGWIKAYNDADNNPEGLEDNSGDFVLEEQKSVEADAQMMEDMEQKSDDELQAIINSPNMYSAEAVATASTVYTLRNSDAIKEQLQAKQLGELQAIISNKHVYCEAYIELVKEVLTQKLN